MECQAPRLILNWDGLEDISNMEVATMLQSVYPCTLRILHHANVTKHGQLRTSALEPFEVKPSNRGRKHMPKMHTITTSEELKTRIKADVSVTVPIQGIAIESSSSYLRSVKTSDTSLVQVIEEIIQDDPAQALHYDLKLSDDASKLLQENRDYFTKRYGEYFVYGSMSRARFTAVCNIRTSSKEVRDEIKSILSAKAGSAYGISTTLSNINERKKESCNMDMNLEIDKISGKDAESTPHFKIGELVRAYDHFQKHFETTPYIALLCHYSVLSPHFPPPQDQFQYLGSKLSVAYQSLYLAQNELSQLPMVQAASCSKDIAKACDMISSLDVNDDKAVANMLKNVQDCLDEVERWRLRFDLHCDAKNLENTSLKYCRFIHLSPGV